MTKLIEMVVKWYDNKNKQVIKGLIPVYATLNLVSFFQFGNAIGMLRTQ